MFSIVIPTHNRISLLKDAVNTVVKQKYSDWELIIFDNASTENISAFIDSLSEQRIRYIRSDEFLPVTDSWNRAIGHAEGEYVTFLGDDDGLIPDYFGKINCLINDYRNPDIIYSAIYQFFHPGVAPWEPSGYISNLKNGFFFKNHKNPFILSRNDAKKAVNGSLTFRRNYTFNIQAFVFSRRILDLLDKDGPIFRSPFPDYYLANIVIAKSSSTLINPEPLSIAGVSTASYGYTLFNDQETVGAEILNTDITSDPLYKVCKMNLLDGPQYNTSYILAMEHVRNYLSNTPDMSGMEVDINRYRKLQITHSIGCKKIISTWFNKGGKKMWSKLTIAEKIWALKYTFLVFLDYRAKLYLGKPIKNVSRKIDEMKVIPYEYSDSGDICDKGSYLTTTDIYEAMDEEKFKVLKA